MERHRRVSIIGADQVSYGSDIDLVSVLAQQSDAASGVNVWDLARGVSKRNGRAVSVQELSDALRRLAREGLVELRAATDAVEPLRFDRATRFAVSDAGLAAIGAADRTDAAPAAVALDHPPAVIS